MYKSKKRKLKQLNQVVFTQKEYIEKKNKSAEEQEQQQAVDDRLEVEQGSDGSEDLSQGQNCDEQGMKNESQLVNEKQDKQTLKAQNQQRRIKQVRNPDDGIENEDEEEGEESKYDQKYEDDYDDQYEEEDIVENKEEEEEEEDVDDENWENIEEENVQSKQQQSTSEYYDKIKMKLQKRLDQKKQKKKQETENQKKEGKTFLGTDKDLEKGEVLDYESRSYEMFHQFTAEWPCLSCDFILPSNQLYLHKNRQLQKMSKYPYSVYLVSGTSLAEKENYIYLMRANNLYKTKYEDDSDDQQSDDENPNQKGEPELLSEQIPLKPSINRIRSLNYQPIVAAWCDNGDFIIVDMKKQMANLEEGNQPQHQKKHNKQLPNTKYKIFKNQDEGFALDWSKLRMGSLLSGSCDKKIYLYTPSDQNFSDIIRDQQPYTYHTGSVEDVQWSLTIETQFASCSTDKTLQICDTRSNNKSKSELLIKAHDCDVNVLSWNELNDKQIVTGGDDGTFKVWDIKFPTVPYSEISFHKQAITSIQFQPNYDSSIAVCSEDNRLTIWDLAVENDDPEIKQDISESMEEIPENLMFIHGGQTEMKELRFHPIYYEMVLSTANNGFHIFKPALDELPSAETSENNDEVQIVKESDLEKYFSNMSINDNRQQEN